MTKKSLSGQPHNLRNDGIWQLVWLLALLAVWELAARVGGANPLLLPPFSHVLVRLFQELFTGTLALQWLQSIGLILAGLMMGSLIGLMLAATDYFWRWTRALIRLLNAVLHPLPGVAILPVVLLIAGLGTPAVLLVIVHATVWSSYLSFQSGFLAVPPAYLDIAANLGASRIRIFWNVLMPLSTIHIINGLKIGWSRAWRALISAEMIFSAIGQLGGLGWYLFERRAFMDIEGVYSAILLLIITGYSVENILFKGRLKAAADTD